jgi:hypothetical protein
VKWSEAVEAEKLLRSFPGLSRGVCGKSQKGGKTVFDSTRETSHAGVAA